MSDKLVKRTKARETIGFVKGIATGTVGTAVLLTVGFWPTVILAGGVVAWKSSAKIRGMLSGKK